VRGEYPFASALVPSDKHNGNRKQLDENQERTGFLQCRVEGRIYSRGVVVLASPLPLRHLTFETYLLSQKAS